MEHRDARDAEIRTLRERLSRPSEASCRINESLDLDTVLQEALDSARSLTGARCGVIVTLEGPGQVEEFLTSGLSAEESRGFWELPGGPSFFEFLGDPDLEIWFEICPGLWRQSSISTVSS